MLANSEVQIPVSIESLERFIEAARAQHTLLKRVKQADSIDQFLALARSYGFDIRFADIVKYQASKILRHHDLNPGSLPCSAWGWVTGSGQTLTMWSDAMYQLLKESIA